MRISIFGLGYVGAVSAGCLAKEGHTVIGVDTDADKVGLINGGQSPIVEEQIGEIIETAVKDGRLRATQDVDFAIAETEISLICVGTPSQTNGNLDLSHVRRVCEQIGGAIRNKSDYHVVTIRSTMLPGSTREVVLPALAEHSGLEPGEKLGVCVNPEFLREGTAVADFFDPPKTVIGQIDEKAGDVVAGIYDRLGAPLVRTAVEVAEMIKYADNPWHAVKVAFANEVGRICKHLGVDSQEVMNIFLMDDKLNVSPKYLRPGFAFGGSCLPKDVRAIVYRGRSMDIDLPVLGSLLPSNRAHIDVALRMIANTGKKRVGLLGLSFKQGTDDLRESPMVDLAEKLLGKGYDVAVYDRGVNLARLRGSNKTYLLEHIPHIANMMMDSFQDVVEGAEVLVISHAEYAPEKYAELLRPDHHIVDLVDVRKNGVSGVSYDGICW